MKLRLSLPASRDLEDIYDYIARDSPRAARRLIERIVEVLFIGRSGRLPGTRELVVTQTSYIAIYQVDGDTVSIARIIHGRQLWPPAENDA